MDQNCGIAQMIKKFATLIAGLSLFLVAACASAPPMGKPDEIAALAREIRALSPDIDPIEADRAAFVAYTHTFQLSREYQITDPPLVHNTKVNAGLRPRGLCWHWAEDMENRLAQEAFQTLSLHRAIANSENPFRIEHSTTIVSAKGRGMYDGIVIDPWRKGGVLTWTQTRADTDYKWLPRKQVLIAKQERRARRGN